MKMTSLFLAVFLLTLLTRANNQGSFVTWVSTQKPGGDTYLINAGEAVRLVGAIDVTQAADRVLLEKDGTVFDLTETEWTILTGEIPLVVAGPAVFRVIQGTERKYTLTFEYLPGAADPQTTVVVPPGSSGGKVQVLASTNLVDWFSADLGTYTNLPAALFFRIDFQKISSQPRRPPAVWVPISPPTTTMPHGRPRALGSGAALGEFVSATVARVSSFCYWSCSSLVHGSSLRRGCLSLLRFPVVLKPRGRLGYSSLCPRFDPGEERPPKNGRQSGPSTGWRFAVAEDSSPRPLQSEGFE